MPDGLVAANRLGRTSAMATKDSFVTEGGGLLY